MEGKKLFQHYGLRKTNVEELAQAAGIAKGTFYHFFESKEDLCMAVLDYEEKMIADDLEKLFSRTSDPKQILKDILVFSSEYMKNNSLIAKLRECGDFEVLMTGVNPKRLEAHLHHDDDTAKIFIEAMKSKGVEIEIGADVLSGVLRAIVVLIMQEKIIGENVFKQVMDNLSVWIAEGLIKGGIDANEN